MPVEVYHNICPVATLALTQESGVLTPTQYFDVSFFK